MLMQICNGYKFLSEDISMFLNVSNIFCMCLPRNDYIKMLKCSRNMQGYFHLLQLDHMISIVNWYFHYWMVPVLHFQFILVQHNGKARSKLKATANAFISRDCSHIQTSFLIRKSNQFIHHKACTYVSFPFMPQTSWQRQVQTLLKVKVSSLLAEYICWCASLAYDICLLSDSSCLSALL
ncbi:Uncharacterized protein TCM_042038 [Theobroma cacao]|uniref:Uncharacterized protein n=1 Tax=Theobroma cacao TaxID=3641 RepID=A0A061GXY3_THECC|nr:Uncharacterized protein TCM_042038 [Theobroma cacao]